MGRGMKKRNGHQKICLPVSILAEVFFPLFRGDNTTLTFQVNPKDCNLLYRSLISADIVKH